MRTRNRVADFKSPFGEDIDDDESSSGGEHAARLSQRLERVI
jgi:hypothetical protein